MNIYVVVEGETATKELYKSWIGYVNPKLKPINYVHEFSQNNFYVLAGYGQPRYWGQIEAAIDDANKIHDIDRLVISLDSEEMSFEDKLHEVKERVSQIGCRVEVKYVIQHFCLETWLLGNKAMFRTGPQDEILLDCLKIYDIRSHDPELLPSHPKLGLNRANFAFRYLKAGIRDKFNNKKYYNKRDAGVTLEQGYYSQVKKSLEHNKHVKSFGDFLTAFV